MQSNSSASDSAPAGGLEGCGGEEDDNATGAGSNLAALNLSLNCWLHILSKETAADLHGDSANTAVRVLIALVYLVVCVLGLAGNLLALFLLHFRRRGHRHTSVDRFVMSLALTDLQFVLTLPFWAVDTVLDFRWPFGWVMCKIVSSVTTMNMYASVFFLTAMSVTRYHLLVTSQKIAGPGRAAAARAKWASLAIWAVSLVATLPHSIYSTTVQVSVDEELCLVRFSESDSGHLDPQVLLGLYQLQKVLLGFVFPLIIISVCYLLLLRLVLRQRAVGSVMDGAVAKSSQCQRGRHCRRSKVTRSVTVVVLSFFICWLPNQALTLWGVLIKLDLAPFSKAFYNAQAYAFPLTVCLAQANSCLNPVLYCLIRQEYRAGLRQLLRRVYIPIQSIFNHAVGGGRGEVAPTSFVMIHKDNV
ncbi:relaxin-3 receptor 1-like [Hippocampus zosterae]|uniref:relaxin-3 receptor 1-like n=1 Tax=Hippocampus zosterae TaxID=109293 RepID=UPI00223D6265|nr:relaxin-3 receptor 1-like [Hippocampus zosterae]